jgi:hypothetical protein
MNGGEHIKSREEKSAKKAYSRPKLAVYGNAREITRGPGHVGNMDNAGGGPAGRKSLA